MWKRKVRRERGELGFDTNNKLGASAYMQSGGPGHQMNVTKNRKEKVRYG